MKKIVIAAAMLLGTSGAWALGVVANTSIGNDATLTYSAGGVVQPTVNTDVPAGQTHSDEFVVDKKIDMILTTTDTDQLDVTPGQTDQITHFKFVNEGNANQYFKFEVSNMANGGVADYNAEADNEDTINTMDIEYSTDNGTTWTALPASGVIQVSSYEQAANIANATVLFRVKSDIPTAPTGADGDVMNIELKATAVTDSTGNTAETESTTEDPTVVDVVLADGVDHASLGDTTESGGDAEKDGIDLARSGYKIKTPVLSAIKTSCVVNDPVNGTTTPKRIPGAVIRYMIDIKNTGTGSVTDLNVTDQLQVNELDYSTIATSNNVHTDKGKDACACANESGGTQSTVSNTGTSPEVKFEGIDVAAPTAPDTENHTCVSFEVEIK